MSSTPRLHELGGEVEDYRARMNEDAAIGRQTPVALTLFLKGAETFLGYLDRKGVEPLLVLGRRGCWWMQASRNLKELFEAGGSRDLAV